MQTHDVIMQKNEKHNSGAGQSPHFKQTVSPGHKNET
jgi:hypothetical protein